MQIPSRFTIAVHMIVCIDYFIDERRVTSEFMSASTNVNPVILRGILSDLKKAGIVSTRQGSGGAKLLRPLTEITLYDVYEAVGCLHKEGLFHFHDNPNTECPVGRNMHKAMDGRLANVQKAMDDEMKKITLADIVEDVRKEIANEKPA